MEIKETILESKFFNLFYTAKVNGQSKTLLRDEHSLWGKVVADVRAAHIDLDCGKFEQNNWVYSTYDSILSQLMIAKDIENETTQHEIKENEISILTYDLIEWTHNSFAHALMELAINEQMVDVTDYSYDKHIQVAQFMAVEIIFNRALKFYIENK